MEHLAADPRLRAEVTNHPYPLLFATLSGAHLYGFASDDSDFDLRGVHVLPIDEVLGLRKRRATVEVMADRSDLELDLVTHDIEKFFRLLLKRNGYVLEQLYSRIVVHTTPEHAELKEIARGCLTRFHAKHYLGFADTQWKLFHKEVQCRVKPLLYVYRVLLTGIHLMRSGEIEADLRKLNADYGSDDLDELIRIKVEGQEKQTLEEASVDDHSRRYSELTAQLERAMEQSSLPDSPSAHDALNDLLLRVRRVFG